MGRESERERECDVKLRVRRYSVVYPQRCVKDIVLLVVEAFNTDPDKTPVVYFATLPLPRPSPAILTPRLCHSHPSPS